MNDMSWFRDTTHKYYLLITGVTGILVFLVVAGIVTTFGINPENPQMVFWGFPPVAFTLFYMLEDKNKLAPLVLLAATIFFAYISLYIGFVFVHMVGGLLSGLLNLFIDLYKYPLDDFGLYLFMYTFIVVATGLTVYGFRAFKVFLSVSFLITFVFVALAMIIDEGEFIWFIANTFSIGLSLGLSIGIYRRNEKLYVNERK